MAARCFLRNGTVWETSEHCTSIRSCNSGILLASTCQAIEPHLHDCLHQQCYFSQRAAAAAADPPAVPHDAIADGNAVAAGGGPSDTAAADAAPPPLFDPRALAALTALLQSAAQPCAPVPMSHSVPSVPKPNLISRSAGYG